MIIQRAVISERPRARRPLVARTPRSRHDGPEWASRRSCGTVVTEGVIWTRWRCCGWGLAADLDLLGLPDLVRGGGGTPCSRMGYDEEAMFLAAAFRGERWCCCFRLASGGWAIRRRCEK